MNTFPRPVLVVSKCLGFEACRYNGQMIPNRFVDRLAELSEIVTVCPEVEIGLGTPRDPIRVEAGTIDGPRTLVQPSTGLDLTRKMTDFRGTFLDGLPEVDGFILKARSPSCGVTDAKVAGKKGMTLGRGPGLFAEGVLARYPAAMVEDEGRLTNFRIREHFLTRVFTTAAFRDLAKRPSMGALVTFHARRKFLFMALNQTVMRELGRIVANPEKRPAREVFADYRVGLDRAFARLTPFRSHLNVLMHGLGYFKEGLTAREKAHFLDSLEQYREGRVPLGSPVSILRSWIVRFEVEYLADQVYFDPYPADLIEITDSGKGRGA